MQNKKTKNNTLAEAKHKSALEELCSIAGTATSKKVFGREYNRMLKELSFLLENEYKNILDYSYRLNTLEMSGVSKETLSLIFCRGLKKVEYSYFDIDFENEKEVKAGIYGYTIAHVYRLTYKGKIGNEQK